MCTRVVMHVVVALRWCRRFLLLCRRHDGACKFCCFPRSDAAGHGLKRKRAVIEAWRVTSL